jgi:hypothetical protein
VFVGQPAAAQTPDGADQSAAQRDKNKQVATDLFDQGVRKMTVGGCDKDPVGDVATCEQACDAFRRARDLYPEGLGALRNLAYTELHLRRLASASRDFRDLARSAQHDARPERRLWADFAQAELSKIVGHVPGLTVHVPQQFRAGLQVTLDGNPLPPAAWDTRLDLDPGAHHVHAESPQMAPYDSDITLVEGQNAETTIEGRPSRSGSALLSPSQQVEEGPSPGESESRPTRIPAIATAGLGVAVTGVGLAFGAEAWTTRNTACGGSQKCDPAGLSAARSDALWSTVLTATGAGLLVGGALWYLLVPSSTRSSTKTSLAPHVGPGEIGVGARGEF